MVAVIPIPASQSAGGVLQHLLHLQQEVAQPVRLAVRDVQRPVERAHLRVNDGVRLDDEQVPRRRSARFLALELSAWMTRPTVRAS